MSRHLPPGRDGAPRGAALALLLAALALGGVTVGRAAAEPGASASAPRSAAVAPSAAAAPSAAIAPSAAPPRPLPSPASAAGSAPYAAASTDAATTPHPEGAPSASASADAEPGLPPAVARTLAEATDATTQLDVERAGRLHALLDPALPRVAVERARWLLYRGECEQAAAVLAAPSVEALRGAGPLAAVARGCAGATAGALVVEDTAAGVRVRLQDDEDRALVPRLVAVAAAARDTARRDLGVELPRPLRLDVVRDLFSLSRVSGLPLEAAETTGTVAVARWGRVILVSPRAPAHGYPWEDTLVHEITHLALARATNDTAPLWLQEGIAKRSEQRWRERRPFDELADPDGTARAAARTGRSVGVDRIGPSVAMLPTPDAAAVAYAEVESFMARWVEWNGVPALHLLLTDMRGTGDADAAMRSTTGFPTAHWIRAWQAWLVDPGAPGAEPPGRPALRRRGLMRELKLGELLLAGGHAAPAAGCLGRAALLAESEAAVRVRHALALAEAGDAASAPLALGTLGQVSGPVGAWFGMEARFAAATGSAAAAAEAHALALAHDPLGVLAACAGQPASEEAPPPDAALCEAARRHAQPTP